MNEIADAPIVNSSWYTHTTRTVRIKTPKSNDGGAWSRPRILRKADSRADGSVMALIVNVTDPKHPTRDTYADVQVGIVDGTAGTWRNILAFVTNYTHWTFDVFQTVIPAGSTVQCMVRRFSDEPRADVEIELFTIP